MAVAQPARPKIFKLQSQTTDKPGFLWVNKGANSDSPLSGDTTEKSNINRHVQRGRKHARQDRRELWIPQFRFAFRRRSVVDGLSQSDVDASEKCSNPESEYSNPKSECSNPESELEQTLDHALSASRMPVSDGIAVLFPQWQLLRNQQDRLVGMTCLWSSPIDPFDVQCTKLDPQVCSLLRYYLDASIAARWQIKSGEANIETLQRKSSELVHACFQSEITMYAILASMAGLRINQEGVPLHHHTSLYIQKAITAIRQHLGTRPIIDQCLILGILNLFAAEWLAFKSDAAVVHLKFVKAMVDQVGGWEKLKNPQVMELILLADSIYAAEKLIHPIFPCDFDPGLDPSIIAWLASNGAPNELGRGLLHPTQIELVPEKLYTDILELIECVFVVRTQLERPYLPPKALHSVRIRNLALLYRLLAMTTPDPRTSALRVTLIMWIVLVLFVSEQNVVQIIAPKLQRMIASVKKSKWHGHEAVLMWMLTIGAMSAVNDSAVQLWFVEEIASLFETGHGIFGQLPTEKAVVDFSKRFLYLDVQRPMIQRLTRSIVDATRRLQMLEQP
jgi:hypothetical protein